MTDDKLEKLRDALTEMVDHFEGSWQERRDAFVAICNGHDKTALEEFISWFEEFDAKPQPATVETVKDAPPPPSPVIHKRKKPPSRASRWLDAVSEASTAIAAITSGIDDLEGAFDELKSVQEEYAEWKDNLPESLSSSPVGEKLEEVCNLDLDVADIRSSLDEAQEKIDEAESIDLPQGFGRD